VPSLSKYKYDIVCLSLLFKKSKLHLINNYAEAGAIDQGVCKSPRNDLHGLCAKVYPHSNTRNSVRFSCDAKAHFCHVDGGIAMIFGFVGFDFAALPIT
jgi:hypothetical protein